MLRGDNVQLWLSGARSITGNMMDLEGQVLAIDTKASARYHKQVAQCVGFQGSAILNYHPRLITITLSDTKDIYSNKY